MTHDNTVERRLAGITLALVALSPLTAALSAQSTEDEGRLSEGSAAHTLPGGDARQAVEPTLSTGSQSESPSPASPLWTTWSIQ